MQTPCLSVGCLRAHGLTSRAAPSSYPLWRSPFVQSCEFTGPPPCIRLVSSASSSRRGRLYQPPPEVLPPGRRPGLIARGNTPRSSRLRTARTPRVLRSPADRPTDAILQFIGRSPPMPEQIQHFDTHAGPSGSIRSGSRPGGCSHPGAGKPKGAAWSCPDLVGEVVDGPLAARLPEVADDIAVARRAEEIELIRLGDQGADTPCGARGIA